MPIKEDFHFQSMVDPRCLAVEALLNAFYYRNFAVRFVKNGERKVYYVFDINFDKTFKVEDILSFQEAISFEYYNRWVPFHKEGCTQEESDELFLVVTEHNVVREETVKEAEKKSKRKSECFWDFQKPELN